MTVPADALRAEQRRVQAGIGLGLSLLAPSLWLLSGHLPSPAADPASRLHYVAHALLIAALPLLLMVMVVASARFRSAAIDPLRGAESPAMVVDGRVLDNTVQQLLLFLVASLALASDLPAAQLPWIAAAATCFAVARIGFWIGYRLHPLLRAPGMAATAWLNVGLFATALWRWLA